MHADPTEVSSEPEIKGKWNTSEDIFEILAGQHDAVRKLFDRLSEISADDAEKAQELRQVGRKLATELISHNEAESQTLYGRLVKFEDLRNRIEEHRREHEAVNAQLASLLDGSAEGIEWPEKFREIRKAVEAHVEDEENALFPQAKKLLEKTEIKTLAGEFTYLQDLRKNLMQPA